MEDEFCVVIHSRSLREHTWCLTRWNLYMCWSGAMGRSVLRCQPWIRSEHMFRSLWEVWEKIINDPWTQHRTRFVLILLIIKENLICFKIQILFMICVSLRYLMILITLSMIFRLEYLMIFNILFMISGWSIGDLYQFNHNL